MPKISLAYRYIFFLIVKNYLKNLHFFYLKKIEISKSLEKYFLFETKLDKKSCFFALFYPLVYIYIFRFFTCVLFVQNTLNYVFSIPYDYCTSTIFQTQRNFDDKFLSTLTWGDMFWKKSCFYRILLFLQSSKALYVFPSAPN